LFRDFPYPFRRCAFSPLCCPLLACRCFRLPCAALCLPVIASTSPVLPATCLLLLPPPLCCPLLACRCFLLPCAALCLPVIASFSPVLPATCLSLLVRLCVCSHASRKLVLAVVPVQLNIVSHPSVTWVLLQPHQLCCTNKPDNVLGWTPAGQCKCPGDSKCIFGHRSYSGVHSRWQPAEWTLLLRFYRHRETPGRLQLQLLPLGWCHVKLLGIHMLAFESFTQLSIPSG